MKMTNLFFIGAWGIVVLCLLPMKSTALEDPQSKLPADLEKKAVNGQMESNLSDKEENSAAKSAEMNNQKLLFGKIADLKISQNYSTLLLDKPDVSSQPSGTPIAESSVKMTLDEKTEITDGTNRLELDDLKIGQHVRVMYEKTWFGRHVVQSIVIQK